MITISLDQPEQKESALKLLKENHASMTNYISMIASPDKFAEILDKEWRGPVPHTILIAPGGKIIYRHSNAIDPIEVKKAIVDFIGRTYANR